MTVRTTISSTIVKPARLLMSPLPSPLPVWNPVQAAEIAFRMHVVHVFAAARRVGRARVAAQRPRFVGQRIGRDTPQEVDARALRIALVDRALDERRKARRIAGLVDRLVDRTVVRGALVGVDRLADIAQRAPQLLLLAALHGDLGER